MNDNKNKINLNIDLGFLWIITFILMVAKIWGKLSISWITVFAPLWLPIVIVLGIALIFILVGVVVTIIDRLR